MMEGTRSDEPGLGKNLLNPMEKHETRLVGRAGLSSYSTGCGATTPTKYHIIRLRSTYEWLATHSSLIGHSRWALPHYTEMGHSSSSF